MKNQIVKIRILFWGILFCIVFWLLYMAIAPDGKISYVSDFAGYNYFISKLTPVERVGTQNLVGTHDFVSQDFVSQKITGDPVYFSLRTPRTFDKAKLILKYKYQCRDAKFCVSTLDYVSTLPIIEAGVLADKIVWRYDLRPIENNIIDQLSLAWDVVREGETILLQREKRFNSIDEFLDNMPDSKEIALYNYNLGQRFILEDYVEYSVETHSTVETHCNASLRGAYQFYIYIKDEDLDIDFVFEDLNKNSDADPIDIHLYYDNQLIDSRHLDDDTSPPASLLNMRGEIEEKNLKFKTANLPEGAYKVELRANDDIVTKKLLTTQSKLSFINKIRLAEGCGENIVLYTDSRKISAQTINPAKLQTILVQGNELEINKTYKQFSIKVEQDVSEIKLAQDDIILAGDGVFSFSQDALINPEFKKVNVNTDINKENINYVLANYVMPEELDGWKIASAEFDLSKSYREDNNFQLGTSGKYGFIISIPGLRADDEIDDWVEIGEIAVKLEGRSLYEKVRNILTNK